MTRHRLLSTLSIVAALGLGAAGCSGDEPAPAAAKGGGASKGGGDASARKELEKNVATLGNALTNAPLDWDRTQADCDKYAREAKEAGFNDLVQKLEAMKKQAKEGFEPAADKEVKEALATARKYVADGDFPKAKNRLNGCHKNLHKDDRYESQIQAGLSEVALGERAGKYYDKVTKAKSDSAAVHEDWEIAQGVLEAFMAVPTFAASPRAKDVQKALAEVKPKADKVRAARATEQAIRWTPAFNGKNDDLFKWELLGHDQEVNVKDGVARFDYNDAEGSKTAAIRFGDDEWEDYILDVTFKLEKGAAHVNVHGYLENEVYNWQPCAVVDAADCKDKDRWYKLRCEVRGKDLKFTPPGSSSQTKTLKSAKGPFEIRVDKGTVMLIKSVWVKVLKPSTK